MERGREFADFCLVCDTEGSTRDTTLLGAAAVPAGGGAGEGDSCWS